MIDQGLIKQSKIDIKKYKRIEKIGQGTFSSVYKIQDKKSKKYFAAKSISFINENGNSLQNIEREIEILMQVNYNSIIKYIGYSNHDLQNEDNPTIIMEYAKNGSLDAILKNIQQSLCPHNYTNTTRQIILIGIAGGMRYLHNRNIIHRDLKPGNILLTEEFHPLITDFGLSKIFCKEHCYTQTLYGGTLSYMAPEILKGEPYNEKVDVYSFGILMYEVVTDQDPYPELQNRKLNEMKFMQKVKDEYYRPRFNFPIKESIKNLIEQCWSNDPINRPTFQDIYHIIKNDYIYDDVDDKEVKLYIEDIEDNQSVNTKTKINTKININTNTYQNQIKNLKVVMLGSQNVGKTTILRKYVTGEFADPKITVSAAIMVDTIKVDQNSIELHFWDTAGQERYRSLIPQYLRDANIFILVYDINNIASYNDLQYYLGLINDYTGMKEYPLYPVILVGNKTDLGEPVISIEKIERFIHRNQIKFSILTSAKTGEGFDELESCLKRIITEDYIPNDIANHTTLKSNIDISEEDNDKKCC